MSDHTTISVPRDVAREFVRTCDEDGWGVEDSGFLRARIALRAALLTAAPTLLDEPAARVEPLPAMTAEEYVREWVKRGRKNHAKLPTWEQAYQDAGVIEAARRAGYIRIGSSVSCPIELTPEGEALVSEPTIPAMTAELLAALRETHNEWKRSDRPLLDSQLERLLCAIERAGIVQPSPTPDEIAAARQVIERAGMKVTP